MAMTDAMDAESRTALLQRTLTLEGGEAAFLV